MKINKKLNLVIPVDSDDGKAFYVHSTPISADVFKLHYLVIAKTFSKIYNEGLGITAGPRIAALILEDVAKGMDAWEDVQRGLIAEIHRLTNVVALSDRGWEPTPYHDALKQNLITPEDAAEIENALVFFTAASSMHKRDQLRDILDGASQLWGARTESLNSTEFARSLPTSTQAANSGGTPKATSQVPY